MSSPVAETVKDVPAPASPAKEEPVKESSASPVKEASPQREASRSRSKSPARDAEESKKSRSRSRSRSRSKSPAKDKRSRSRSRSRSPKRRSSRSRSPRRSRSRSPAREQLKLYIGNLNYRTRERDLEDEFTRYGRLSDVFIPTDRHRGGSRGFGFVTFEDKRDAEDAVKDMDGREIDGRRVEVNFAKARGPNDRRGGPVGGGGFRGGFRGGPGRGSEICRDFQRGSCFRGQSCRFSHEGGEDRSRGRSRSRSRGRRSRSRSRSRSPRRNDRY